MKRWVPVQFAKLEPRKIIWNSLKTDAQSLARIRANTTWAEQVALWEAKLLGRDGSEVEKYRAAQQIASAHGFKFQHLSELQTAPLEDILERVEELAAPGGTPDAELATALLGNVTAPRLKLSGLEEHVQDLTAHDNRFKSSEQMPLWLNPRKRAVGNLIKALGEDCEFLAVGPSLIFVFVQPDYRASDRSPDSYELLMRVVGRGGYRLLGKRQRSNCL